MTLAPRVRVLSPDGSRVCQVAGDRLEIRDAGSDELITGLRVDDLLHECAWTPGGDGVYAIGTRGLHGFKLMH